MIPSNRHVQEVLNTIETKPSSKMHLFKNEKEAEMVSSSKVDPKTKIKKD